MAELQVGLSKHNILEPCVPLGSAKNTVRHIACPNPSFPSTVQHNGGMKGGRKPRDVPLCRSTVFHAACAGLQTLHFSAQCSALAGNKSWSGTREEPMAEKSAMNAWKVARGNSHHAIGTAMVAIAILSIPLDSSTRYTPSWVSVARFFFAFFAHFSRCPRTDT